MVVGMGGDCQNGNQPIKKQKHKWQNINIAVVNPKRNNKPNLMDVTDIVGHKPQRSKRVTNPVAPVYVLPSFEARPFTPPKKIRDTVQIDDIDGLEEEKQQPFPLSLLSPSLPHV